MISTDECNEIFHEMWCKRLNIEDFEVDYSGMSVDKKEYKILYDKIQTLAIFDNKTIIREKLLPPPIFKWKKNGEWFEIVVPIQTKSKKWNCLFSYGDYDVIDWSKMFSYVEKIISAGGGGGK